MKIRELTGYKSNQMYQQSQDFFGGDLTSPNTRIKTLINFQKYMMSQGFKSMIGSPGSYAVAFEKDDYPWVFKVFTHDPSYLNYFKFAKQNQSNPHVIKIKGGLFKINENTFVVRLEKLRKGYGYDFNRLIKILNRLYELEDFEYLKNNFPEDFDYFKQYHSSLFDLVHTLAVKIPDARLDLHRGNVMMRGDTIVLSDPLS